MRYPVGYQCLGSWEFWATSLLGCQAASVPDDRISWPCPLSWSRAARYARYGHVYYVTPCLILGSARCMLEAVITRVELAPHARHSASMPNSDILHTVPDQTAAQSSMSWLYKMCTQSFDKKTLLVTGLAQPLLLIRTCGISEDIDEGWQLS